MKIFYFQMSPFPYIFVFSVFREHVLGIINLLTSAIRIQASLTCFIALLLSFVVKQACLVLLLSESVFLSDH